MSDTLFTEAVERIHEIIARSEQAGVAEPTAASLATVDERGLPTVRVVLLRNIDARGFVFYTNTESEKGRHLLHTPYAALCLYAAPLWEQVQARGPVTPVDADEADEYWASRPRENQIGAWASDQSRPIARREDLKAQFARREAQFEGGPVPRPPHWSGFRLMPEVLEFWQGRQSRLHDRQQYTRTDDGWVKVLLQP